MPLELSFEESQNWLKSIENSEQKTVIKEDEDPNIQAAIAGGEKMSNWIKLINANRAEDDAIRLTSAQTQRGIPIDKPSIYSPKTIREKLTKLSTEMPKYLLDIMYGAKPITKTISISDEDFIKWSRQVSGLYQTAVRWKGMQPWLGQLEARATRDVRGYYYLKNLENLDYTLQNADTLASDEQDELKSALSGICINATAMRKACPTEVDAAFKAKTLLSLKNKYWSKAVKNWDAFFEISDPRSDVEWKSSAPHTMHVVFKEINDQKVANWLKENVEDEFKMKDFGWSLEMSFIQGRMWPRTAFLEFQPNVTPHVSGGNKIVMDANTALEEYNVRWTIRHEYGHILRLPDCYHEFYDRENNQMINYQLDITDLMCSRAGKMNKRIYDELKKVYFK